MGHDHHDHGHVKTNSHAIPEGDGELPLRIRSIELIKHNPNLFHVPLFDSQGYEILGGAGWLTGTVAGAAFGYWYYAQKTRLNPTSFYAGTMLAFSRIFLGAVVGGWIGYLKFGDR